MLYAVQYNLIGFDSIQSHGTPKVPKVFQHSYNGILKRRNVRNQALMDSPQNGVQGVTPCPPEAPFLNRFSPYGGRRRGVSTCCF